MAQIILQKKERYVISDKFYLLKTGTVCVYEIFSNGKALPKETCIRAGEIIGNFLRYFPDKNIPLPEIEIEVIAMEDDTVLEEFQFEALEFNLKFSKIFTQLLKENLFNFLYHIYDKESYLLSVLKFYADESGILTKKYVRYDNFFMSKTKFYTTYGILKDKNYIKETEKDIHLNLKKINKYFADILS